MNEERAHEVRPADRRRAGRLGAGAVALALASVATGCGDDDASSDGKAELVAAADAICARLDVEGTELSDVVYGPDFSREPTLEEQAEFLRQLVANVDEGRAEVAALAGPEEGKALLDRVFGEDPFVEDARDAIALADAGDQAGFEAAMDELFGEGGEVDEDLVAEATDYGFQDCVPS